MYRPLASFHAVNPVRICWVPAIAAAAKDDLILVHPGDYSAFTLDKGLRILGSAAGVHVATGSVVTGVLPKEIAVLAQLEVVDLAQQGGEVGVRRPAHGTFTVARISSMIPSVVTPSASASTARSSALSRVRSASSARVSRRARTAR